MARNTTRRMPRLESLEARKLLSAADVTGEQQLVLELINEALIAPESAAERVDQGLTRGAVSAIAEDGDSVERVISEIAEADPKPPVAWDADLAEAAKEHTEFQIELGRQTHSGPSGRETATDRAIAAGYVEPDAVAENIIFGVDSPDQAMNAFLADFGPGNAHDPHRENIQQPDADGDEAHQDVGVAVKPVEVSVQNRTPFGTPEPVTKTKLVVTQVFGRKEEATPRLLGVVFDDGDADRFYDVGEGVSGAKVTITETSSGDSTEVTTWSSGGYQSEVQPGDYQIEVRLGDRLIGRKQAKVGRENTKVDFLVGDAPAPPRTAAQVATPVSKPAAPVSRPVVQVASPASKPATSLSTRPTSTPVEPARASRSTARSTSPPSTPTPSTPAPAPEPSTAPEPVLAAPSYSSSPAPAPVRSSTTSPTEDRSPRPNDSGDSSSSRAIDRLRNLAARAASSEPSGPGSALSLLRSSLSGNLRSWKIAG